MMNYTPELSKRIKNIAALQPGVGAKYLICIIGQGDDLVAKEWKRKLPKIKNNEILIKF